MITGTHHAAIRVTDMERSLKFYRDILGLEVVGDYVVEEKEVRKIYQLPQAPKLRLVFLQTKGEGFKTAVELIQFLSPERPVLPEHILHHSYANNYIGVIHVCFVVKDIDATYKMMAKKGVEFNHPPISCTVKGFGEIKLTFFKDPDGALLEILEPITPASKGYA